MSTNAEILESRFFLFIPMESLGLLESMIVDLTAIPRKKDRQREYNRVADTLKNLRLIAAKSAVHAITLGTRPDGSHGLFVLYSMPTEQVVSTQPLVGEPK